MIIYVISYHCLLFYNETYSLTMKTFELQQKLRSFHLPKPGKVFNKHCKCNLSS